MKLDKDKMDNEEILIKYIVASLSNHDEDDNEDEEDDSHLTQLFDTYCENLYNLIQYVKRKENNKENTNQNTTKDMLVDIWDKQKELDNKIFENKKVSRESTRIERFTALNVEIGELLKEDEIFKYWKDHKKLASKSTEQLEKSREEYIDALHFFISLGIDYFNSPEEMYEYYMKKNLINHDRLKGGY